MNAQRKTVYALRQQLLLGRYQPEEVDETGKPTGDTPRNRGPAEDRGSSVAARGDASSASTATRSYSSAAPTRSSARRPAKSSKRRRSWSSRKALQRDVYELWGVKLDLSQRKQNDAARGLRGARRPGAARAHRAARAPARPDRPHHQRDGRGELPREPPARRLGLEGHLPGLRGALQGAPRRQADGAR